MLYQVPLVHAPSNPVLHIIQQPKSERSRTLSGMQRLPRSSAGRMKTHRGSSVTTQSSTMRNEQRTALVQGEFRNTRLASQCRRRSKQQMPQRDSAHQQLRGSGSLRRSAERCGQRRLVPDDRSVEEFSRSVRIHGSAYELAWGDRCGPRSFCFLALPLRAAVAESGLARSSPPPVEHYAAAGRISSDLVFAPHLR